MPDLSVAFAALPVSPNPGGGNLSFHTILVAAGRPHCLAKSDRGQPCLLVVTRTAAGNLPAPMKLEHLSVQHGLSGTIHGADGPRRAEFSLITLSTPDGPMVDVFLRFAEHLVGCLPDKAEPRGVAQEMRRLVEMLQNLRHKGLKTIQGLWAEMFLIYLTANPSEWVEAWHSDPMELHDFCLPELRVEVKSSATRVRKHSFSHRQLCSRPDAKIFIASVFVERVANGISVHDLATHIRGRLAPESALKLDETMIATLGSDYGNAGELLFDSTLAEASLKFFDLESLPRLPETLPDRIFDISYAILLNEAEGTATFPPSVSST
jgi:hypothetical protein